MFLQDLIIISTTSYPVVKCGNCSGVFKPLFTEHFTFLGQSRTKWLGTSRAKHTGYTPLNLRSQGNARLAINFSAKHSTRTKK